MKQDSKEKFVELRVAGETFEAIAVRGVFRYEQRSASDEVLENTHKHATRRLT